DPSAGTSAGDMRFNTNGGLGVGPTAKYDLFTVALHEACHVFGFDDSTDPSSVMDVDYLGTRSALSAGDIARLQALHGARQADAYEGSTGNGTLGTATRLDLLADANGVLSVGVDADLTTRSDADVYRFTAPSLTGGLVIQLQHAGLSLLTSKVTV